jgi:hypothetical protein
MAQAVPRMTGRYRRRILKYADGLIAYFSAVFRHAVGEKS